MIETNQTREQLNDPEWAGYMLGKTLLGRLGRPEEVAKVALFLACGEGLVIPSSGFNRRAEPCRPPTLWAPKLAKP